MLSSNIVLCLCGNPLGIDKWSIFLVQKRKELFIADYFYFFVSVRLCLCVVALIVNNIVTVICLLTMTWSCLFFLIMDLVFSKPFFIV